MLRARALGRLVHAFAVHGMLQHCTHMLCGAARNVIVNLRCLGKADMIRAVCSGSVLLDADPAVAQLCRRLAVQLALHFQLWLLPLYELPGLQRLAILGSYRGLPVASATARAVSAVRDTNRVQSNAHGVANIFWVMEAFASQCLKGNDLLLLSARDRCIGKTVNTCNASPAEQRQDALRLLSEAPDIASPSQEQSDHLETNPLLVCLRACSRHHDSVAAAPSTCSARSSTSCCGRSARPNAFASWHALCARWRSPRWFQASATASRLCAATVGCALVHSAATSDSISITCTVHEIISGRQCAIVVDKYQSVKQIFTSGACSTCSTEHCCSILFPRHSALAATGSAACTEQLVPANSVLVNNENPGQT